MSYDHLLFRMSSAIDATNAATENDLASIGTPDDVEAMLRGVARVVAARVAIPGSEPEWSVASLTGLGVYAISPWLGESGEVRTLNLRGAWREDAVHLARALGMSAFDPQCGQDVYPYRLQTLSIAPPAGTALTLRWYRDSTIAAESPVSTAGERFQRLSQWCQANQDRWHPAQMSYTTFEPEVEVSAGIFGLKLAGRRAMVYGWASSGPFEREVDPASYGFLLDREPA